MTLRVCMPFVSLGVAPPLLDSTRWCPPSRSNSLGLSIHFFERSFRGLKKPKVFRSIMRDLMIPTIFPFFRLSEQPLSLFPVEFSRIARYFGGIQTS